MNRNDVVLGGGGERSPVVVVPTKWPASWNHLGARTKAERSGRVSDRRGLPHGKEGGLRDYSCTHRDGEGKGRKISQDPKHDHFSLIST